MILSKPKFLIPITLILAFLATYEVYAFLKNQEAALAEKTTDKQQVVVASINIAFGDSLSIKNTEIKFWPPELIPEGTYLAVEDVLGRVLKTDLTAGEPVMESKLAPDGSLGGVLSQIPNGMRAMTVPVSVVSGVGGFVLPRTRVDILATIKTIGSNQEPITKTILQDVLVLAVDQEYRKDYTDPVIVKSVTLLVNPEQAESLTLASTEGKLQLILRNTADSDTTRTPGIKLNQFTNSASPKQETPKIVYRPQPRTTPAPTPPPVPTPEKEVAQEPKTKRIEVIRSNQRTQVEFDESGQSIPENKR